MYLFRVFGEGGVAKTREQRTKLRKRGLKREKGRRRRAKVRGKRGKIWGRVRWGNYPAWKWKKNGKSVKYAPYDKKETFTPLKSTGTLFCSILEKSIFGTGRFLRCQDTYLCTKNRHRVYYVENPVDNHFSLWITLYHIVFNTTSLLVYSVRCPSADRGTTEGENLKNRCAARRGKSFLRAFSDFFKKLFHAQNLYFRLFSPVLRTTTRACVFIIFEKKQLEKFFWKRGWQGGTPAL